VKLFSQESRTIFRFEILSLLRDRRTVMVSVVLPALLTPLLLSAGQWMQQRRESQAMNGIYWVGVEGENPALAESLLLEALSIPVSGDSMNIGIGASYPADPEEGVLRPEEATVEVLASPSGGQPTIRILYRADDEGSSLVASSIQDRFLVLRDTLRTRMLSEDGCRFSPDQAYVTTMDTSPPWRRAGARVGSFAVLFLMLFLLSGGAVVAIDMVAGERERGTLETLLASSASRAEIVQAKFLAILTVSAAISLTQLLSLVVCISVRFLPSADLQALRFGPWVLAQAVLLIASLAALVSATLLLVSGRAASVKEAQLHYFPVFLLAMLPALAPVFPELTSAFPFVFIPVSGVALCMRDVLAGRAEFLNVLMASVSTFALAGVALWAAYRALVAEKMVTGSESRAGQLPIQGPEVHGRHVGADDDLLPPGCECGHQAATCCQHSRHPAGRDSSRMEEIRAERAGSSLPRSPAPGRSRPRSPGGALRSGRRNRTLQACRWDTAGFTNGVAGIRPGVAPGRDAPLAAAFLPRHPSGHM
jgi:sodium transport system permease protein